LVAETKKYAGEMDGVDDVEVKVVMDPPWTQDMMSDDARDQLGIF
jgi:metal-sulfur cluster biosynthetic enzyme